jgi:lipid-binding SYLF domain-containing protein
MKKLHTFMVFALLTLASQLSLADSYDDTINLFKQAGESASFFDAAYAYAVFPNIVKGGLGVGAARGSGRVFRQGTYIGDVTMTQVSVGAQVGGKAYSEIIFFQDERALNEFKNGNFEFDASMSAVAITAAAGGTVGTTGARGGASGGKNNAVTAGSWHRGMAVFTIVKGGAMYSANVAGQKFSFKPREPS